MVPAEATALEPVNDERSMVSAVSVLPLLFPEHAHAAEASAAIIMA